METSDNFKNSPVHDKKRILAELDKLTPSEMIQVAELLIELNKNKPSIDE